MMNGRYFLTYMNGDPFIREVFGADEVEVTTPYPVKMLNLNLFYVKWDELTAYDQERAIKALAVRDKTTFAKKKLFIGDGSRVAVPAKDPFILRAEGADGKLLPLADYVADLNEMIAMGLSD